MRRVAALALLVAAVGAAAAPATDTKTFDLDPFGEVEACLPFNLAIDAGNATAPSLVVTAEQAVLDAVRANVSANGTLSLGASPFSTSAPIKATLRVPADALTRVVTASPGGSVVLATGLAPAGGQLTLAAYGGAELHARSVVAATLNASANGAATLVAQGAITGADVAAVGGSRVYVAGVTDAADVRARGAARVYVAPSAANASITGTVGGPAASVTTTKGACDLEWAGAGAGARTAPRCVRASVTLPPTTTKLWTCGVALVGKAGASCDAGFGTVVTGDGGGALFPWADDDASFPGTNNPAWNQVNAMMNAMMGGGGGPGMMNGAFAGAGPGGAFAGPFGGRKLAGAASFASSSGDGGSSYMSSTTDSNGKTTIVTGGNKAGGAGGAVVTGRDGATIYTSDGSPSSGGATFVSSGGRGAATVINNNGRVTYVSDGDAAGAPAPTVVAAPRCAVADKDRRMVN